MRPQSEIMEEYAETGKPGKALPLLRFLVQNVDAFVVAQMLAADGYPGRGANLAELNSIRPLLADAYGPDSTQIRNLDKQPVRLETPQ